MEGDYYMQRDIDLREISDGKLYGSNDMVKVDCQDCAGCSDCCRGMGTSLVLDPLDVHTLCTGLGKTFEELLEHSVELNVCDGVILPNLKMAGEREACVYLDDSGRCSIHEIRPGFCRMFPLGRYYEGRSFRYFLQIHECSRPNRSKIKVKKWLDRPDVAQYEQFVGEWHYFLKDVQELLERAGDDGMARNASMYILKNFYLTPFDSREDFYQQFAQRIEKGKTYFF